MSSVSEHGNSGHPSPSSFRSPNQSLKQTGGGRDTYIFATFIDLSNKMQSLTDKMYRNECYRSNVQKTNTFVYKKVLVHVRYVHMYVLCVEVYVHVYASACVCPCTCVQMRHQHQASSSIALNLIWGRTCHQTQSLSVS